MADEQHHTSDPCVTHDSENAAGGEIKDRGLFDFLGKKEEVKPQDEAVAAELEKVHISEVHEKKEEEEEKKEEKHSLAEKLHRSHSSSSSSSSSGEEEEGKGGEKKKKKKGLKEKTKEKISGEKEEDTTVPVVKNEDVQHEDTEEKKGFLEKIKEKLPGGHPKKADDVATTHVVPECAEEPHVQEGEAAKEKKGLLEKIKEKLPGYHKNGEEKKEETPSH